MWPFLLIAGAVGIYLYTKKSPPSQFQILSNMWENPSFKAKITPDWESTRRPNDKDLNNVEPPRHILVFLQKVDSSDPPFLSLFEVVKSSAEKNGYDRSFTGKYVASGNYDLSNPTLTSEDWDTNRYLGDQPKPGDIVKIGAKDIFVMKWGDVPGGYEAAKI
jgi:hypothetical protein